MLERIKFGISASRGELVKPIGQDSYATIYRNFAFMPNNDTLIRRHGMKIYRDMMNDVEVSSALNSKRNAVIASSFQVIPASNEPDDRERAEFIEWNFAAMSGSVEDLIWNVLSSCQFGYSVIEKLYDISDWTSKATGARHKGLYVLSGYKPKNPEDYAFKTDIYGMLDEFLLRPFYQIMGVPVPIEKFIVHIYNPQFGWPHGYSDLRAVYKHWWSKDFLIKWWNIYCETFGMPTRVARYPKNTYAPNAGTDLASQKLLGEILENIQNATAITLPDDIKLDFIQVANGGWAAFDHAIQYHDRAIKMGIQGQVLTSGQGGSGSGGASYALAKEHGETKEDIVEALRIQMCDAVLFEQIIKPLIQLNFGNVSCPTIQMIPRRKKLYQLTADDIVKLSQIGLINKSDYNIVRDQFNLPPLLEENEEEITIGGNTEGADSQTPPPAAPKPTPIKPASQYAKAASEEIVLNRKPNRFEKHVDFSRMASDMMAANKKMASDLRPIVEKMKSKMLLYIDKNVFVGDKADVAKINGLMLMGLPEYSDTVKNNLLDVYKQQLDIAYSDTNGGLLKHARTTKPLPGAMDEFAKLPTSKKMSMTANIAMLREWKKAGKVDQIKAWRVAREAEEANKLGVVAQWATNSMKTDIVSSVQNKLMDGIIKGTPKDEMMSVVGNVFENYIARDDVSNKQLANAPSLSITIQCNTSDVFNDAREQASIEGAASGEFPADEFSAILDDVTCEECAALDGEIHPVDDPFWDEHPPGDIHPECRCMRISVAAEDTPEKWGKQNINEG